MPSYHSGADAIAAGVLESGVSLVTGYPGSPATSVVDAIQEFPSTEQVQVIWNTNEKTAAEMAFGASLAGSRSLLCVKSVGFNIALDPLMTINLADCNAGFVILVGDDPGGWSSQNEQDSRAVALATELPILEPASVSEAYSMLPFAYQLSEGASLPVIVRVTKALIGAASTFDIGEVSIPPLPHPIEVEAKGKNVDGERWNNTVILPINVVSTHHRLHQKLEMIQSHFEQSPFNIVEGNGQKGVLVGGYTYQKLLDLLNGKISPQLSVARLGTFYPLPEKFVMNFLKSVESVLVLEETAPLLEDAVTALAQRTGLILPIYGRHSGDVARAGELNSSQLANALNCLLPEFITTSQLKTSRTMPSKQFYPSNCPYIPIFEILLDVVSQFSSRQDTIIIGDPGCMVRGQKHYDLMDVKTSLGASISIAAGISRTFINQNIQKCVIALTGDSSFLHTNFNGLVDAVRIGAQMLVLVLDNNTTALSGGQPHPGTRKGDYKDSQPPVEIAELAVQAGAKYVQIVDIDRCEDLRPAILRGLQTEGVSVVIARGECPGCP